MAISEAYNGTEAVGATEHSLVNDSSTIATVTTDGVYQAFLDVSDMVAGDVLRIRVYEKVRSSSTQRIVYEATLGGPQADPVWVSPSLILIHGWDMTVTATSGTITVDWSIRSVA